MEQVLKVRGWAAHVWLPAIAEVLTAAGFDPAEARTVSTPVVWDLPGVSLKLSPKVKPPPAGRDMAMNVVGHLRGSDPRLRSQSIVVTAHMDHLGVTPGQADSVYNGADDNASGVAGLIELAKAFSQPGVRPRRSILFVGVSGSAKGFWGSHYWYRAPAPGRGAGINLDMIGREASDSVQRISRSPRGPSGSPCSIPSWG
jgi:hypothetical protein